MRILLWHGYLLRGSGSNVYTANLAKRWREAGHDVLLMCQQRVVDVLDFVDAHGDFAPDNRSYELNEIGAPPAPGRVSVLRPAIGEILPVYVFDEYEGFRAKRFIDLDDAELDAYTTRNVEAMVTAIEEFRPEAIITGHEVMGPYIALKACERTGTSYITKLHGSALEYAVKVQERYRRFATEGLTGARVVVGGSEYMIREASSVVPGWLDRAAVVNPGCDIELFRPPSRPRSSSPTIGYVGKLIVSKGVHHLLPALGLVAHDDLRAVIVGYGGYEAELHALWAALRKPDFHRLRELARAGDGHPLEHLEDFLASSGVDEIYLDRIKKVDLEFTGRLEHGPLSKVLPYFDVLVVPSVLAEAFGMVGAEAAACEVLPVVPRHSGIGEVGEIIERELGKPGLLTFDPHDPIRGIAATIGRILELDRDERMEMGQRAAALARRRWSWTTVADSLLAHARGDA